MVKHGCDAVLSRAWRFGSLQFSVNEFKKEDMFLHMFIHQLRRSNASSFGYFLFDLKYAI